MQNLADQKSGQTMINADLSLLPPFCYLTRPFNRALLASIRLMWRFRWLTLTLLGFSYLAGIVVINIPMLDIASDTSILVVMSPLFVPLWLMAAYLLPTFLLLTFFARNPNTRLGFTLLFSTMVLAPVITVVMSDTRLMLIMGDNGFFFLFLPLFIGFPWLYFRYKDKLLPHARWSSPALVLVIALLYWEGAVGFSTSQISPEQYSISGCKSERPVNKHGVKGDPVWSCQLELSLNGFEYSFPDMPLPDSYLRDPEKTNKDDRKQNVLEIRHGLFDHFTLR